LLALTLAGAGINFFIKINAQSRILPAFNLSIGKINLNQADKEILMEAPGIGEKLAQRILDYRSKQGEFRDLEELKNIAGINGNRYEKLKDYFVVQ